MKSNTALTATMTARQSGKSILGNKINTVSIDEWDEIDTTTMSGDKPVEYFEYTDDPLALVCSMLRYGKQPYEAVEVLNSLGRGSKYIKIDTAINQEDYERANAIYDYFVKKHTLRRIKGEWISEYMLAIEDLCNTRIRINKEHVKILASLPRIYEQNKNLERIIKGRNSVKHTKLLPYAAMHTELEFVDRVRIKHAGRDEMHYYWSTPKNYLVRFVVPYNQYGMSAWDFITSQGKISLDSEVVHTYQIKGYNFNVLQPNPAHMEIKPL
jgi:hypothetical protein